MAVDTGLVRESEIRVANLTPDRFLIHLPKGLAVETFVKKTPNYLWNEGFVFQQWSQADNTTICMPRFKVLVDLIGVPPQLMKEAEIIKVISKFGLYLGTVEPEHESDLSAWRVAFATDDLLRVPDNVGMVSGGFEHPVRVRPIIWKRGAIYGMEDFPKVPPTFTRPPTPPPSRPTSPDTYLETLPAWSHDHDLVSCSKKVLMELCANLSPDMIPPEIRAAIASPARVPELSMEVVRLLVEATDNPSPSDLG